MLLISTRLSSSLSVEAAAATATAALDACRNDKAPLLFLLIDSSTFIRLGGVSIGGQFFLTFGVVVKFFTDSRNILERSRVLVMFSLLGIS